VIRAEAGQLDRVLKDAREALRKSAPTPVLTSLQRTVSEDRSTATATSARIAWMLVSISVLLLLVTVSGIVGMTALRVAQRRKQIGVRRAPGRPLARYPSLLHRGKRHHHHRRHRGRAAARPRASTASSWRTGHGAAAARVPRVRRRPRSGRSGICAVYGPASKAASISPAIATPHRLMATVLVIDDNASIATALDVLLSLHDIETVHADSPAAGPRAPRARAVDLVIQDMNFAADTTGGEEGRALFRADPRAPPDLPVILLTAWTHLDMAVELIKAGAADYVAKPWSDERLVTTVRNLVELGEANRALRERAQRDARGSASCASNTTRAAWCGATRRPSACWSSPARWRAPTCPSSSPAPTAAARNAWPRSSRRTPPCATALRDAQLRRDAARADRGRALRRGGRRVYRRRKARAGKFEAADGGTLFLDEIGNLPRRAGEAPARARDRALPAPGLERGEAGARARDQRHERRPPGDDPRRHLPAGPVLSPERDRARTPAARPRPDDIVPLAEHFMGEGKRLRRSRPCARCSATRGRATCAS
jgi:FixJ family two-component response regulator